MKRHLVGQLQRPGRRPENIELMVNVRSNDQSATTVSSTSYTAVDIPESGNVLLVDDDTAGAQVTITLPPAIDSQGVQFHIKKLGSTASVVIDPNGSETIDGATTLTISAQYDAPNIYCDGAAWYLL